MQSLRYSNLHIKPKLPLSIGHQPSRPRHRTHTSRVVVQALQRVPGPYSRGIIVRTRPLFQSTLVGQRRIDVQDILGTFNGRRSWVRECGVPRCRKCDSRGDQSDESTKRSDRQHSEVNGRETGERKSKEGWSKCDSGTRPFL